MPSTSDVKIEKILNSDLDRIAVVNQGLDNQWVSRGLLYSILKNGNSLQDPRVVDQRWHEVRHEWLRSLLNAQQVIVTRASLLNNPVIYHDY